MTVVRGWVIGVGSAAIVVAGVAGCSSDKKSEDKASSAASPAVTASSGSVTAAAGAGTATVTIDGKPQEIKGQVACTTMGGNLSIGIGDQATGVAVMMSPDASTVTSVGLGNVNGVALGYQQGAPGGSATATKDGQNYTISGSATGVDMANPMQPMTKPFEIKVTCP
jgi:lipoprotein LpqH